MLRLALASSLVAMLLPASAGADPLGHVTELRSGLEPGAMPISIAAGRDGNMWFADHNGAIGRVTPRGKITEFDAGLPAGSRPSRIVSGPDGSLWFVDSNSIGRITRAGAITEFRAGLNPGAVPSGIAAGPDGNLWFTDVGATPAIGRITPSGAITEFTAGLSADNEPDEIAAGRDGNLWFLDDGPTVAIGRVTTAGAITEFSSGLARGSRLIGLTAGPGGMWFTDVGRTGIVGGVVIPPAPKAVGRITPSGAITKFTAGLNPGAVPTAIAAGPDGNVWFTDMGDPDNGRPTAIGRVTPAGAIREFDADLGRDVVPAIAAGPDGDMWFTNAHAPAIGRIGTGVDGFKVAVRRAALRVEVPGPGTVALAGRDLIRQRVVVKGRAAKLTVRLTAGGRRKLRRAGRLIVTARITYTPAGGAPQSKTKRLTLT